MTTVSRKPPIRAKHYLKPSSTTKKSVDIGIEDVEADFNVNGVYNAALSVFNGSFQQESAAMTKLLSLVRETFTYCGGKFLDASQYLFGLAAAPSMTKAMEEILEAFGELDNQQPDFEHKKAILYAANQDLCDEIAYRERIVHNILAGNGMFTTD